jgi:hypothetical protein
LYVLSFDIFYFDLLRYNHDFLVNDKFLLGDAPVKLISETLIVHAIEIIERITITLLTPLTNAISAGTTAVTRKAAAQQIGEIQKYHPYTLYNLLERVCAVACGARLTL